MAGITKKIIADAFLEVAERKPIDKVTVKDIVEVCGITRQTFYYHFQDILEVIEWLMAQFVDDLLARTMVAGSPREAVRVLVGAIEDHPSFIVKLMQSRKREETEHLFINAVRTYFLTLLRCSPLSSSLSADDLEAALIFYSSGIVALMIETAKKPHADLDLLANQILRLVEGKMGPERPDV